MQRNLKWKQMQTFLADYSHSFGRENFSDGSKGAKIFEAIKRSKLKCCSSPHDRIPHGVGSANR
jgi:hypothetical protein